MVRDDALMRDFDAHKASAFNDNTVYMTAITIYDVTLSTGRLNTTLINDFHGENTPIFRGSCTRVDLHGSGPMKMFIGQGNMQGAVKYYNTSIARWEPVLEEIVLLTQIEKTNNAIVVSLSTESSVQLNLSAVMLKSIMKIVSTFHSRKAHSSSDSREIYHKITIENHLGVDVDIFSSGSDSRKLFHLPGIVLYILYVLYAADVP
jgi:hypothetical protein